MKPAAPSSAPLKHPATDLQPPRGLGKTLARWASVAALLLCGLGGAEAANIVVNSTADPANPNTAITIAQLGQTVTLRDAVNAANNTAGADTISFDPSLAGQKITLLRTALTEFGTSSALLIDSDITIQGLTGNSGITIDGGGTLRVLYSRSDGTLTLNDLTVSGGQAGQGAGIQSLGTLHLNRCTVTGNHTAASGYGGGILIASPAPATTLVNCTITGNSADIGGGGIYFSGTANSAFSLKNVTIAGNSIGINFDYGGGLAIRLDTAVLTNTIIAGNTKSGGAANDVGDQLGGSGQTPNHFDASSSYNLIGSTGHGGLTNGVNGNLVGVSASLGTLASNGGPTQTISPLPGSPAIDGGIADAAVPTDQRGITRPQHGGADIGAFEYDLPLPGIAVAQASALTDGAGSVAFGTVNVGSSSAALTFTITNPGDAELNTLAVSEDGANPGDFIVSALTGSSVPVGASSVTFTVTFSPAGSGTRSAALHIASNVAGAKNPFDIAVSGSGNAAPTLSLPASPVTVTATTSNQGAIVTFDVTASDAEDGTLTPQVSPASGTFFAVGDTTVNVSAIDSNGVTTTGSFTVHVDPLAHPVNTPFLATGAAAPGQGTNGLPADAKITSLGVPAIDDAGHLAYLAKWTSATGGRGTGLFLDSECLAVIGGDASAAAGTMGAKWKSFTDPVADSHRLACIAGLTGVPAARSSMVVLGFAGGGLQNIAQTGDIAPDLFGPKATGPKFTSFTEVAINGPVAFLAKVTASTGADNQTAAKGSGIWLRSFLPVQFGLGLGDTRAGKTIKTLVAFSAGNGSPGQGRGTIFPTGLGIVPALALFTDKSSAIVVATPPFLSQGTVTIAAQTGTAGDNFSPALSGAKFASFGFPATNGTDVSFLGSLAVGPGNVAAATKRGIFLSDETKVNTGPYSTVARIGLSAPGTDASFSDLKDPVLAADGSIAFPATLKGGTATGLAATTLWWQPAGRSLGIVAQGGQRPGPDLPALAQWKSFTSLGIGSGRGPLFTGTLVVGKGGITAKNATGVWACDFTGAVRTLFRTGDPGPGNTTLTSFTLLNATVGSTGSTRSFNAVGQVAWLATYSDKSQAIVVTDVP